jgi:hypothetical protein
MPISRDRIRRFYWDALRTLRGAAALPAHLYAGLYIALRLNALYHRLGAGPERQIALLPRRLWLSRRLMHQPYRVKLGAIKWGGRPQAGSARVDSETWCGYVLDGSWDIEDKRPIEDYLSSYVYSHSALQIFRDHIPYAETEQYKEMTEIVRRRQLNDWRLRGCRSEADIEHHFQQLMSTYRAIAAKGYKSQAELGSRRWYDEIKVFIDRNGELHKQQGAGHHRLAMARTLDLDTIPVVVIGVHKAWALAAQREFGKDVITSVHLKIRRDICHAMPD